MTLLAIVDSTTPDPQPLAGLEDAEGLPRAAPCAEYLSGVLEVYCGPKTSPKDTREQRSKWVEAMPIV